MCFGKSILLAENFNKLYLTSTNFNRQNVKDKKNFNILYLLIEDQKTLKVQRLLYPAIVSSMGVLILD